MWNIELEAGVRLPLFMLACVRVGVIFVEHFWQNEIYFMDDSFYSYVQFHYTCNFIIICSIALRKPVWSPWAASRTMGIEQMRLRSIQITF